MGRVSKYKKVKKFDKEHKGGEYVWGTQVSTKKKKRSLTAEKYRQKKMKREHFKDGGGFDVPHEKDDFDINDFVVEKDEKRRLDDGLVTPKHQTVLPSVPAEEGDIKPSAIVKNDVVKIGNRTVQCTIPMNDRDEKKAAKMLQLDPKTGVSMSKKKHAREINIEGRRQGESMTAFRGRLKEETKKALAENYKKEKEPEEDEERLAKIQRKKEYAKLRKLKKKGKGRIVVSNDSDDELPVRDGYDNNDNFVTGEQAVSFLERAERPPTFDRLPRGAHKKLKLTIKGVNDDTGGKMDEGKIKAEQNSMEIMRRKVQAQYALLKAKRKQQGGASFHL
jgi:hypothetical protein